MAVDLFTKIVHVAKNVFTAEGPDNVKITPRPTEEVSRYALVFNGTAGMRDEVAAQDLGLTKELVNEWLTRGYDKIYLLMTAKNLWENDPRVVLLPPTEAALKIVTGAMAAVKLDTNDNVEVMVMGHGGGEGQGHYIGDLSAEAFVAAINLIPTAAQRIIRLSQCHSASMANFKGLRDDNDILMAFAGNIESPKEPAQTAAAPKKQAQSEFNWTDGRNLGYINGRDLDGDKEKSNWEMFWQGISQSFKREFPYTRGFIFDVGLNYVDYGFGTKPLAKPFPSEVVWAKSLVDYIELVGKGYERGVTVTCASIDYRNNKEQDLKRKEQEKQFAELAEKYKGWVQFVGVPPSLAAQVMGEAYWYGMGENCQIRFSGEGQSYLEGSFMTFDEAKTTLDKVLHGMSPKSK